jgi:hypothetical protein
MKSTALRMFDSMLRTQGRDVIVDVPTAAEMAAYQARAPLADLRTFTGLLDDMTDAQCETVFKHLDSYRAGRAGRRSRDALSAEDRRGMAEAAEMRAKISAINAAGRKFWDQGNAAAVA